MRYFKTQLFALAMAALPLGAAAQAIEGAPDGYKLVWSDEFNGTALNEKNWNGLNGSSLVMFFLDIMVLGVAGQYKR